MDRQEKGSEPDNIDSQPEINEQPSPPPPPPPTYESPRPNILSSIRDNITERVSNVAETISSGKDKIIEQTTSYGYMIFVAVFVAIILFILAYLLYIYLKQRITRKIIYELPDSAKPMKCNVVHRLSGLTLPPNVNGNRNTFMFWIYINDLNMFSGNDLRHVMHIGDETTKGSSPAIYLDGMKNRLYVRFGKKSVQTDLSEQIKRIKNYDPSLTRDSVGFDEELSKVLGSTKVTEDLDAIKLDLATHGVIIEYVPLQRWVHVSIVINETVNRGYINTYLDGEVVSSINSNDRVVLSSGKAVPVDFTGLNLDKKGDVYVGGDISNSNIPRGFSGLVSRIAVANFDMNGVEVKKVFYKGPLDSLANNMIIPGYGIRSPIYKIE